MTVNELVNQLRYYRKCYYDGVPIVSDDIFDQMEKELEKLDPSNNYFKEVGYIDNDVQLKHIKHVIPMKSMAKVKHPDDAVKWYEKIINIAEISDATGEIFYEAKIDGNAGSLIYNDKGNLKYVLSRGNGIEGLEIPQGFNFKNIPKTFIPNGEIRGEFYISKKDRDKVNGPLRNICSGILKRKEETPEIDLIRFVMYDFYDHKKEIKFKNRRDKIEQLKALLPPGSDVIDIMSGKNIYLMYDKYISKLRDSWEYETDGIILTVEGDQSVYESINSGYNVENHNKYNLALKPPAEEALSTIVDIKLNVSKHGRIVPVAVIEPVQVCDVTISMVTLDNFAYINKNNVCIGSKVKVVRSNDVIPKIVSVETPNNCVKFSITKCPSCGGKLKRVGVDFYCENNVDCLDKSVNRILYMLQVFEIKNVGEKYIRSIVSWLKNSGRPIDLTSFVMFLNDNTGETEMVLEELFGSSTRKENIKSALLEIFNRVTELKIIESLSISGIARKTLEKLDITTRDKLLKYIESRKNCKMLSATDLVLQEWSSSKYPFFKEYNTLYKLLKPYIVEEESSVKDSKGIVCLSGGFNVSKKEIAKVLIENGYSVVDSVSKSVNYLITDIGKTSKTVKAEKLGIPVFRLDEFYKTILKRSGN